MILEAFSHVLKQEFSTHRPAALILQQWLLAHLLDGRPAEASWIHDVLHTELEAIGLHTLAPDPDTPQLRLLAADRLWSIQARTDTGEILLRSLMAYCESYEDWQYRRWLHHVNASDFSDPPPDPRPDGQPWADGRLS